MVHCIICEQRPARTAEGQCRNCASKIEAERKLRAPDKPVKYLTYRGNVVGLFRNGGTALKARLLKRSPYGLPKRITLDLNTYLPGFDRAQIKAFKACVLKLASA